MQNTFDLLQRRIWLGPLTLALMLLIGLGLGLLIGWVLLPVNWTLNIDDVQAISDSYALNNDLPLAKSRLKTLSPADQSRLLNKIIVDSGARNRPIEADHANALLQALKLSSSASPSSTPAPAPTPISFNTILLGGAAILALVVLATGALLFIRVGLPRLRPAPVGTPYEAAAELADTAEPEYTEPRAPVVPAPSQTNLGRVQAIYTAGMDNFDASFPLETPKQGFLGECGIGVSETVGDGLPDKVTAFDLWLFDKTDVRTVTHILMSDYAFNDAGVRTKLQTKGDAILAANNQVITLETQSLKIEARVFDLVYASNPSLPPNSYFQKLAIEITPFYK